MAAESDQLTGLFNRRGWDRYMEIEEARFRRFGDPGAVIVIDLDGHIHDERVADALLGLRRFSPRVIFLGSYPRADKRPVEFVQEYGDEVFADARDWLRGILTGEPGA
jgi:predicted signal transduction protein with EAL and GGDEF domain